MNNFGCSKRVINIHKTKLKCLISGVFLYLGTGKQATEWEISKDVTYWEMPPQLLSTPGHFIKESQLYAYGTFIVIKLYSLFFKVYSII